MDRHELLGAQAAVVGCDGDALDPWHHVDVGRLAANTGADRSMRSKTAFSLSVRVKPVSNVFSMPRRSVSVSASARSRVAGSVGRPYLVRASTTSSPSASGKMSRNRSAGHSGAVAPPSIRSGAAAAPRPAHRTADAASDTSALDVANPARSTFRVVGRGHAQVSGRRCRVVGTLSSRVAARNPFRPRAASTTEGSTWSMIASCPRCSSSSPGRW